MIERIFHFMRILYATMLAAAYLTAPVTWLFGPLSPWLLLVWLSAPLAISIVMIVGARTDGPSLNGALAKTGLLQLVFCALLSAGLLLS